MGQTQASVANLAKGKYFVLVTGDDCTKLEGPYEVTEPELLKLTAIMRSTA